MITAKNLKKAGFLPGNWEFTDSGDKYRTWCLSVNEHCTIKVDEDVVDGKTKFNPCLSCGDFVPLNLDDVTKLLTLKDLLK